MNKHIWIIDDDPGILEVTQIILEEAGYQVTAINNEEVLNEKLQETLPDLILLDILLSGIEGPEISHRLKTSVQTQHIPIILMSANTSIEEKVQEALADDYIRKPFDIDVLEKIVKKYLKPTITNN
jgi:DNA-binding response OmpR family regulator